MCGLSAFLHRRSISAWVIADVKSLDTPTGLVQIPPSVQSSWTAVPSACSAGSMSVLNQPPNVSSGEVFRPPTVPRPQCQSGSSEGTSLQVGALFAMDGMEGPEVDMVRNACKRALEAVRGGKVQVHQNHFHQKTFFIKNQFHQRPLSSKTIFIKNQFHQKPISSEHFLSEGPKTRAKTM